MRAAALRPGEGAVEVYPKTPLSPISDSPGRPATLPTGPVNRTGRSTRVFHHSATQHPATRNPATDHREHATQRRNLAAAGRLEYPAPQDRDLRLAAVRRWQPACWAAPRARFGLTVPAGRGRFCQGGADYLPGPGISQPAEEAVLIHSGSVTAGSASFHGAVRAVLTGVRFTGLARNIQDPYGNPLVSADGHDALVRFNVTSSAAN